MYSLVTQYNSLVKISEENLEAKEVDKLKTTAQKSSTEPEVKSGGIKITVLNKYSKLLADKHPMIVPQILRGVGVDVGSTK